MRIVLIADVFPPMRSSGAVQLRDLSQEFVRQGHDVTVMVASPELDGNWRLDHSNGVRVLRLRTPKTKDVNYVRRAFGEFLMPFAMLRNLKRSPLASESWDGVVWYSPTIFLGPIANALKARSNCPSYLIVRDIFPEWAADMGLMGRGLPYKFFKVVARYQYAAANVIGVQTPGNLVYFKNSSARTEVLHNWLDGTGQTACTLDVSATSMSGRKIFVYAGNMGVAQGMGILLDLASELKDRNDIGFLFVGRGSEARRLRGEVKIRGLDNVLFFDEIEPDEIPGLYAQCHVGLVALDPRHKTHNIPGKFLSYMHSSLPVLASINDGNDLVDLIERTGVGRVCTSHSPAELAQLAAALLVQLEEDTRMKSRCKSLAMEMFSPETAVESIVAALEYERHRIQHSTSGRLGTLGEQLTADEATPQYSPEL